MRRLLPLALLVPLASGCGWASLLFGGHATSSAGTATTVTVYPSATVSPVPRWAKVEHLPRAAIRGAALFASAGCTSCHTYAGSGTTNLGAPDLTAIGRRHLGIGPEVDHLECPSCVNAGSPMPSFAALGRRRLHQLAIFLEASRGVR